jgi:hypothetical protein
MGKRCRGGVEVKGGPPWLPLTRAAAAASDDGDTQGITAGSRGRRGDAGVVRCHEAAHLHRLGRDQQPLDDRENENEPCINDMTTSDEFDDGNSPASS